MEYKPIRTEAQWKLVSRRIEQLVDAEPGTPEAAELKILTRMARGYNCKFLAFDTVPVARGLPPREWRNAPR